MGYTINTNYLEIITGTSNTLSPVFREAAENVDKNTDKGAAYLQNFVTSIENIASKKGVNDPRISKSRGNIKNVDKYENIEFSIGFLKKKVPGIPLLDDITTLHDKLVEFQSQYSQGYDKNCRLIILEYESVAELLITGLSMTIANNVSVEKGKAGEIKVSRINKATHGVYDKMITAWANILKKKDHKEYLDGLIKGMDEADKNATSKSEPKSNVKTESYIIESRASETIDLVNGIFYAVRRLGNFGVNAVRTVKNTIFGVVPLIRSVLYLKYKKKADTVNALDEQCLFIKRNIEQLQNMTNMDPKKKEEIIKKQEAVIEAYQKKAAKLRAELMEGEKEASNAIAQENPEIKKTAPAGSGNKDDEFVLEGIRISDMFKESDDVDESQSSSGNGDPDKQKARMKKKEAMEQLKGVIKDQMDKSDNNVSLDDFLNS